MGHKPYDREAKRSEKAKTKRDWQAEVIAEREHSVVLLGEIDELLGGSADVAAEP